MIRILVVLGSACIGMMVLFIAWFIWPMIRDANMAAILLIPTYVIYRLVQELRHSIKKV